MYRLSKKSAEINWKKKFLMTFFTKNMAYMSGFFLEKSEIS